jgi:hypothetical protein
VERLRLRSRWEDNIEMDTKNIETGFVWLSYEDSR